MYFVINRSRWASDEAMYSPLVHGRVIPTKEFLIDWLHDEFADPKHRTGFEMQLVAWTLPDVADVLQLRKFRLLIDKTPDMLIEVVHLDGLPKVTLWNYDEYGDNIGNVDPPEVH